jgi:hypothetical protein
MATLVVVVVLLIFLEAKEVVVGLETSLLSKPLVTADGQTEIELLKISGVSLTDGYFVVL